MGAYSQGLSRHFNKNDAVLNSYRAFCDSFSLVKAYSALSGHAIVKAAELEHEAYKLRYHAYCQEHSYEQTNKYGIERDVYDSFSAMLLVQHKATQTYLGTVRLIPFTTPLLPLPVTQVCDDLVPQYNISTDRYAEISRLSVSYTRMEEAQLTRQEMSLVLPGLLAGVLNISRDIGTTHLVGAMSPTLLRKINRSYGVELGWVGCDVDYHGRRVPFIGAVDMVEESIKKRRGLLRKIVNMDDGAEVNHVNKQALPRGYGL
tara:strand:- start:71447 stop:72226 length:780 start_codon:yes stop_codon:yes gene_type:complete